MFDVFPSREVALEIFGMSVYWYGILYVVAFWFAWRFAPYLQHMRGLALSRDDWTYIAAWCVGGVVVGGRLGYVLLYEPGYFASHPFEIFALRGGGMSAHGGFAGVALGAWYATHALRTSLLKVADVLVFPAAVGLALGRMGNYVNRELFEQYGALRVSALNVGIGVVCYGVLRAMRIPGSVSTLFLVLYGVKRLLTEQWKIDEWGHVWGMSAGQAYTVPLILVGIAIYVYVRMRSASM